MDFCKLLERSDSNLQMQVICEIVTKQGVVKVSTGGLKMEKQVAGMR